MFSTIFAMLKVLILFVKFIQSFLKIEMKKITIESVNAFLNGKKFNKSNMNVEVLPNVTILKYQGNAIAYKYNDPKKPLCKIKEVFCVYLVKIEVVISNHS